MGHHDTRRQHGQRRFSIEVAGRLSEDPAEEIGGIEQRDTDDRTTIAGKLVDQSQIYGILDRPQQIGIEVLRLETHPAAHQGDADDETASEES